MGEKGTNLKYEAQKKAVLDALRNILDDFSEVISKEMDEFKEKVSDLEGRKMKLIHEVKDLIKEKKTYEKRINHYDKQETELNERDLRIVETEKLLEKEKKLATSKKQHLIEWERELNEKARRLNG